MQPWDEKNSLEKRPFQREVVIIHPVVSTLKVAWSLSVCNTIKYSYAYVWNTCHSIYSACIFIYYATMYVLYTHIYVYTYIYIWHIYNDISINHPHTMDVFLVYQVASHHLSHPRRRREGSRPGKWWGNGGGTVDGNQKSPRPTTGWMYPKIYEIMGYLLNIKWMFFFTMKIMGYLYTKYQLVIKRRRISFFHQQNLVIHRGFFFEFVSNEKSWDLKKSMDRIVR